MHYHPALQPLLKHSRIVYLRGHDCCETVKVSLCAAKQGFPALVVAEGSFQFVQDEAYDAAQFLATCAGNQLALNFTRFLDRSRPPSGDVDFLDEKVALAFRHLKLPAGWNVLGADHIRDENVPRETLMHFAVRLGLLRLTWFLLQQPGGRGSLSVPNREGATPVSLALEKGYHKLHQLLTQEEASEPDSWGTLSHTIHSGEYCVKYHRGVNVYTLTVEVKRGTGSSMEDNISCLRAYIQSSQLTNMSEHPHPPPESASKGCSSNTEGLTSATNNDIKAGSGAGPSSPASLDAMLILVPACPKEKSCRQPKDRSSTLQSLENLQVAEEPELSSRNQNKASLLHKEEPPSAVNSWVIPEISDSQHSSGAGTEGAAELPYCAVKQKVVGMNSPSLGLEEGNLGERHNFHQEVETVEERTTGSAH
uniref:Uncharacterized protein n=1 Tax=Sphaerodactylus townsendi TaxID=933632 RepID=A0ACB8E657_9SAUR